MVARPSLKCSLPYTRSLISPNTDNHAVADFVATETGRRSAWSKIDRRGNEVYQSLMETFLFNNRKIFENHTENQVKWWKSSILVFVHFSKLNLQAIVQAKSSLIPIFNDRTNVISRSVIKNRFMAL